MIIADYLRQNNIDRVLGAVAVALWRIRAQIFSGKGDLPGEIFVAIINADGIVLYVL